MIPRSALALFAAPLVCLVVAGCGGGQAASSGGPALIPHSLGLQLVGRVSAVEASLSRDDQCTALAQVTLLQKAEATAIAARQVPAELQASLLDSTQTLVDAIHCTPPPGEHHHHRHGKGHGEGD